MLMANRRLIYLGLLVPVIFWSTIVICGNILDNYSHTKRLVSELGALGTKTQYLFTAGLLSCSILSIVFMLGLYKTAKQLKISVIPVLLIVTYSFSSGGAALFPMPLRLHALLGMPSILLFLSPLTALFLWRKIPGATRYSFTCLVIMLLGFLIYVPGLLNEQHGLKQRFFHMGWTVWFCYLVILFLKLKTEMERRAVVEL
jgi:hypothetical membrane protein